MSQRHQEPKVANAIEVGKEILSKNNNLDRGDKRDLIQKNNLQQVKKDKKKKVRTLNSQITSLIFHILEGSPITPRDKE